MPRRVSGTQLKMTILRSQYLPDHPTPFRKQQVALALAKEDIEVPHSTLDTVLFSLLSQGYLMRTEQEENPKAMRPYHLWMFARPDRGSTRPDFEPGGKYDIWKEAS